MKQPLLQALIVLVVAAVPAETSAQPGSREVAYPVKPIRIVVQGPPGGTPDIQVRMMAEKIAPRLGQQLVVDNRPGANGNIAMGIVAKAPADGYTLIIATVGTWAMNPYLYDLSHDVVKDFAPIIHVATTPAVLVVHPSLPVKSVKELIALAIQKPGELNYGSAGVGGFGHVSTELFGLMTKARMTHVPYKGALAALTDLVGGQIQVLFNSAIVTIPQITSGRVRALATTGSARLAILRDLPTVAEAGVPGYENSTWSGIAAPARTPQPIIERLNGEFAAALQTPDVKERLAAAGSTVTGGTPRHFSDYLKSELVKFGKLVKEAGIKAER